MKYHSFSFSKALLCGLSLCSVLQAAPVITLNPDPRLSGVTAGRPEVYLYADEESYTELGATAEENGVEFDVTIGGDIVDTSTPGIYTVTYDAEGADQVTRTVFVTRRVYYVNAQAADGGDGASWTTAFNKLQDALDITIARPPYDITTDDHHQNPDIGQFGLQQDIWVAAGTYYPDEGFGQVDGDRSSTFKMNKIGIVVYGGFAGDETSIEERDLTRNVTILSGDLDQDDIDQPDDDNAYHVMTVMSSINVNRNRNKYFFRTRVQDVTIMGGNANGTVYPDNIGGGALHTSEPDDFVYLNCLITGNRAVSGGGVGFLLGENNTGRFQNTTLRQNTASEKGGALYVEGNGVTTSINRAFLIRELSIVEENTAPVGGGLYIKTERCFMDEVILRGNQTTGSGRGGAAYLEGAMLRARNTLWTGNRAAGSGGALFATGSESLSFSASTFAGNFSEGTGGAIALLDTTALEILGCLIWNNLDGNPGETGNDSFVQDLALPNLRHNLVQYQDLSTIADASNLDGTLADNDPLFMEAISPFLAPTTDGDYRLQFRSPAIDQGIAFPRNDLLLNEAVGDGRDIGAFEFIPGPYEDWIATYFLTESDPDLIGLEADPNGDGVSNALAFMTGGSPIGSAPGTRGIRSIDGNTLSVSFSHLNRASFLNPQVFISTDLTNWSVAESGIIDGVEVVSEVSAESVETNVQIDQTMVPHVFYRRSFEISEAP